MARAGGGVLREGQQAPSPPTRGSWVNAISFPSGIQYGAQAAKKFSCILDAPDGLSWNLLGVKFVGYGTLQSAYDISISTLHALRLSAQFVKLTEPSVAIQGVLHMASLKVF